MLDHEKLGVYQCALHLAAVASCAAEPLGNEDAHAHGDEDGNGDEDDNSGRALV